MNVNVKGSLLELKFIPLICISTDEITITEDNGGYGFNSPDNKKLIIGEKYLGIKYEHNIKMFSSVQYITYYDVFDLNRNIVGCYSIQNFKEVSIHRNEQIENILK